MWAHPPWAPAFTCTPQQEAAAGVGRSPAPGMKRCHWDGRSRVPAASFSRWCPSCPLSLSPGVQVPFHPPRLAETIRYGRRHMNQAGCQPVSAYKTPGAYLQCLRDAPLRQTWGRRVITTPPFPSSPSPSSPAPSNFLLLLSSHKDTVRIGIFL